VYFFLVKNDDTLSQQDRKVIFEVDSKASVKELRKHRLAARKKKLEKERRKLSDGKVHLIKLHDIHQFIYSCKTFFTLQI